MSVLDVILDELSDSITTVIKEHFISNTQHLIHYVADLYLQIAAIDFQIFSFAVPVGPR